MTILTLIVALLRLAPMVLEMIRDGRIKDATTKEVLSAFEAEFTKNWQARVDAAVAAGDRANSGVVQHDVTSEGNDFPEPDPFDRASARKIGRAKNS